MRAGNVALPGGGELLDVEAVLAFHPSVALGEELHDRGLNRRIETIPPGRQPAEILTI